MLKIDIGKYSVIQHNPGQFTVAKARFDKKGILQKDGSHYFQSIDQVARYLVSRLALDGPEIESVKELQAAYKRATNEVAAKLSGVSGNAEK